MCDVWQLPNGNYTEENFWHEARKSLFPYLKEVDMLSGEPFIQNDTFKLIAEVNQVNPDCKWSITTNAHWKLGKKVTDALDSIVVKNLILSVDSFDPKTYAKIRYPGKLDLVLGTIEKLLEYQEQRILKGKGSLNFNLNFLVQKDNWTELSSAIDYCLSRNIHPFLTFCYRPIEHSLLNLEDSERVRIIESIISSMSWDKLTLCHRILSPLFNSIDPLRKSEFLLELRQKKLNYEKKTND
jgi:MoaA/NifB/PqqE/SkfB family radical SAM enzyme